MSERAPREHWASKLGFVLAAAGSAIGLGNIWKFPYITGENGGGAFVLVYLICILIIGLPVMLCELVMGRKSQRDPVGAYRSLKPRSPWVLAGFLGVAAGFFILSFYSVVAGWTLGYIAKYILGKLPTFPTPEAAGEYFRAFASDPVQAVGYHALFMVFTILIVYKGIRAGIERWSKILMPILLLLLLVLIVRGLSLPGAMEGVRFYLSPDFSKLTGKSVLIALGHAFFSLSLGMGAMITYGSYLSREDNIFRSGLAVCTLDTVIAILAGLAMFPAVFAMGLEPGVGPGLVFNILPVVFTKMAGGGFWGLLFFLLLSLAALTSAISLLEVVTAYFVDEWKWRRHTVAVVFGFVIFLMGTPCALSFGGFEELNNLLKVHIFSRNYDVFGFMDNVASNYMLPLGGFLICLFVGWVWGTRNAVEEIRHGSTNFADVHVLPLLAGLKDDPSHNSDIHVITLASVWGIFIRFISPVAVAIAFLFTVGAIQIGDLEMPLARHYEFQINARRPTHTEDYYVAPGNWVLPVTVQGQVARTEGKAPLHFEILAYLVDRRDEEEPVVEIRGVVPQSTDARAFEETFQPRYSTRRIRFVVNTYRKEMEGPVEGRVRIRASQ